MDRIRVPERTATPTELEEDRRRCLAAKAKQPTPAPAQEGNLCGALVLLAAWKPCDACGDRVLYVDENAKTDTRVICGRCEAFLASLQRTTALLSLAATLLCLVLP